MHRRTWFRWGSVLPLLALLAGCDTLDTAEPPEQEYVVEAYLGAEEPLGRVRLSRSTTIDTPYDITALGVTDATIVVHLLRDDGSVEATYPYLPVGNLPGVYFPQTVVNVQSLRRYRLEVTFADRPDRITAETLVPEAFRFESLNRESLVYQSTEQFEIVLSQSRYPGRQNFYVFTTESLDPRVDTLTPFYLDFIEFDTDADQDELVPFIRRESPIINQDNYELNDDGTLTIRFPWLAVVFFGDNIITANALDDNLYDFIRSNDIQQGGSTLSPGELPNVLDHVEGGNGVFGSFARASRQVFIARP